MKKAIKIDVVKKTLYEVAIKDWRSISPAIGNNCRLFACPVTFENDDVLYVDDEGLINHFEGGFMFPNWSYPLVGNGIILGSDEQGESVDYVSNIEHLKSTILFFSREEIINFHNPDMD